jgi:LAO/AO transport system kinase
LEPKGVIAARRKQQAVDWLTDLLRDELQRRFDRHPRVQERFPALRESLLRGEITAVCAARSLLAAFDGCPENSNYDHKN